MTTVFSVGASRVPSNWVVKRGWFEVPKGALGDPLERATKDAVKKFVAAMSKQGWNLMATPVVSKVQEGRSDFYPVDAGRGVMLWLPTNIRGMRTDHPWYVPDRDQYEVTAYFSQPPKTVRYWLPDSYVAKYGLPKGFKLEE